MYRILLLAMLLTVGACSASDADLSDAAVLADQAAPSPDASEDGSDDDSSGVSVLAEGVEAPNDASSEGETSAAALALAEDFIAAHGPPNQEIAMAMVHPDAQIAAHGQIPRTYDDYEALFPWFDIVGWHWESPECTAVGVSQGTRVQCDSTVNTAFVNAHGAFDLPYAWEFLIEDDLIVEFSKSGDAELNRLSLGPWAEWLYANHPEDVPRMMRLDDAGRIVGGPHTTEESMLLYAIYSQEFLAHVAGEERSDFDVQG